MKSGIKLSGIGSALPKQVISNDDLAKFLDTSNEWITERTGIQQRYICSEQEDSVTLSVEASLKAIAEAGIQAEDIDVILVATSTPEFHYPNTACRIQSELGAKKAFCLDLSAACSGFIYALFTAAQFIQNNTIYKNILIVGVDIHSRFIDWSDRNTAILFGDAAGAVLVQACDISQNEYIDSYLLSYGQEGSSLELEAVGSAYPQTQQQINNGIVTMNGRKVYQFAVKSVPHIVNAVCERAGYEVNQIDYLACHQANQRILDASIDRLGLDKSKNLSNIAKYGNTSAASLPLLLDEYKNTIKQSNNLICMAGFGAGLTAGSILWKFQ